MNAPAGAAVPRPAPRLAILYPGDRAAHDRADPAASRFAALFAAFAAAGMHAEPAIYHDDFADEVGAQLHGVHGVLVWHNPIEGGRIRARLDALLRDVAGGGASGVFVSTHPDVILRLGTKDVLLAARALPFGSDVHRVDSIEQLRAELTARLARGARVLKQHRGHSGIGVWRVEAIGAPGGDRFSLRHAERGSAPQVVDFEAVVQTLAPYFAGGGHMVDQAWQPRLPEGMVRAYLVGDRVAGFGHQAVNALHPGTAGGEPPPPGPRLYSGADDMRFQALRERLESEWVAQLAQATGVATADLPLLWDADFLLGERSPADIAAGRERHVLCEVNVSSVAPFPDAAIAPLVAATLRRLQAR